MTAAPEVVDLFCGVGGLSHGLKKAGCKILAGYDTDERCRFAFETNNAAEFWTRDVSKLTVAEIRSHYSGTGPSILAGCAPCQPFSTYKFRYGDDPQWNLVHEFARLATELRPDAVTMENVPTLLRYKEGRVFERFRTTLQSAGYRVQHLVADCKNLGVPQRRRRLVVIATLDHDVSAFLPAPSKSINVRDAIGDLPPIAAGAANDDDRLHVARALTPLNMKRIKLSRPGGTWKEWPVELRAKCHQRDSGRTYGGVYARMKWDGPAPTMTTQCYGYGNGRFGHPEQDRAITLREAAILQSFPPNYEFLPSNESVHFNEVGRWIGNAVPVKLAQTIGEYLISALGGANGTSESQERI